MHDNDRLIAQYLANGGAITRVPPGRTVPNRVLARTGAERFFRRIGRWPLSERERAELVRFVQARIAKP